jgi:hypothetical protein
MWSCQNGIGAHGGNYVLENCKWKLGLVRITVAFCINTYESTLVPN